MLSSSTWWEVPNREGSQWGGQTQTWLQWIWKVNKNYTVSHKFRFSYSKNRDLFKGGVDVCKEGTYWQSLIYLERPERTTLVNNIVQWSMVINAIGMKWQTVYFWFKFVDCLHCIQRHVLLLHLIARVLSNRKITYQAKVYFWNIFQQIFVWLFRFGIQHARVRKQHILISAQGRTQHTGMKKNLKLLKLVRQRLFIFMHENILKIWFIPREVWYEGWENQINLLFLLAK